MKNLIMSRNSVRDFLPTPVPEEIIRDILETACHSPSGANMQPWLVWVVTGDKLKQVGHAILTHIRAGGPQVPDYDYYPSEWVDPYKRRRIATGVGLYNILGIQRSDKAAREAQWHKNYEWFGAPVVLFVMVERRLLPGAFLDLGAFMQSICLAAKAKGLDTCVQASTAEYGQIVRRELGVDESKLMAYSIVLGYRSDAVENGYKPPRVDVDTFTRFLS